jgi:hypothetical protein
MPNGNGNSFTTGQYNPGIYGHVTEEVEPEYNELGLEDIYYS